MMSPPFGSSPLRRFGLCLVAAVALWRAPLSAHDMWIEPATLLGLATAMATMALLR